MKHMCHLDQWLFFVNTRKSIRESRYEISVLLFSKLSKLFLDTSIQKTFLKMMKITTFRGDFTDISGGKEALQEAWVNTHTWVAEESYVLRLHMFQTLYVFTQVTCTGIRWCNKFFGSTYTVCYVKDSVLWQSVAPLGVQVFGFSDLDSHRLCLCRSVLPFQPKYRLGHPEN